MIVRYVLPLSLVAGLLGCDQRPEDSPATATPPTPTSHAPSVLFLGTSLTAGLGINPEQAYPALIQRKIDSAGLRYRVINAGVSGETSAGALRRVGWLFRDPISVLVVETGANDGLRGLSPDSLRSNIQAIFDRARQLHPAPRLVLLGMRVPPNYGKTYSQRFQAVYRELAEANNAALVPFLLEGVGGISQLNQADGIHPTGEGQQRLAATVWKVLEPVLREQSDRGAQNDVSCC